MDGDSEDVRVPITPRLLADLQAGLLDDDTATRLRRQAREDPAAARVVAALDRVPVSYTHLTLPTTPYV